MSASGSREGPGRHRRVVFAHVVPTGWSFYRFPIYLIPLNCSIRVVKIIHFMVCVSYHHKKKLEKTQKLFKRKRKINPQVQIKCFAYFKISVGPSRYYPWSPEMKSCLWILKEKIHYQCMGLTVVSSVILNGETDLFLPSKDMTVNMCTGKTTHWGSTRLEDLKLVCFGNTASISASSGWLALIFHETIPVDTIDWSCDHRKARSTPGSDSHRAP